MQGFFLLSHYLSHLFFNGICPIYVEHTTVVKTYLAKEVVEAEDTWVSREQEVKLEILDSLLRSSASTLGIS